MWLTTTEHTWLLPGIESVNSIDSEHWSQFTCEEKIPWQDHMLTVCRSLMLLCTPTGCERQLQTIQLTVLCTGLYNSSKKILLLGTSYQCEVASTSTLPITSINKHMNPSLYYCFFVWLTIALFSHLSAVGIHFMTISK